MIAAKKRKEPLMPVQASLELLNPERHEWACNFAENPAWHHADARSRGQDRRRVVDALQEKPRRKWVEDLYETVLLPPHKFIKKVPPLLVKNINEPDTKVPWGPWPDPFFVQTSATNMYGFLAAGKPRQIASPCVRRRMLDILFEGVLIDTGDHLLSPDAWAYRPNRWDAVRTVIGQVQSKVRRGRGRFWAKLDLKSFFPSIPWRLIRRALDSMGYPKDVIQRLMGLVEAPLVDIDGNLIPNSSGSQAGVRISGVLANMVLKELDELIRSTFGKSLGFWRYSDDIILVHEDRKTVEDAVRLVRRWCHNNGLRLKGVAP